jgi:hypothetical protein
MPVQLVALVPADPEPPHARLAVDRQPAQAALDRAALALEQPAPGGYDDKDHDHR